MTILSLAVKTNSPTRTYKPSRALNSDSDSTNKIRQVLIKEMKVSKRTGYWFRLSRQERGIYSLALRLNVKFESFLLLKTLIAILKKLKEMGSTAYRRLMLGTRLAWAFSQAAVSWGNEQARLWRNNTVYAEFLGRSMAEGRSP